MELLGVPEQAVLKYIREKGLPARKISHQYMGLKERHSRIGKIPRFKPC